MLLYAFLGVGYSFFIFLAAFGIFYSGITASFNLFNQALGGVMRSPVGWHGE